MKILKCPFGAGSLGKNPGASKAPDKILEQTEDLYLNEAGFAPKLDPEQVPVDPVNIEETIRAIMESVKQHSGEPKLCILGGDHSITYAGFRAFKQKNPDAGLLILDAHPDCERGTDMPSHEDFVRKLVREGILEKQKLILFGIRNWTGTEKEFLDTNNIKYFTMKQIAMNNFSDVIDGLTETISSWPQLYVSIDIDVADPSCAPGTGYMEPGGLTARQLIQLIQRLRLLKNLKMFDIVEVGPDKDINDMTSKLAAKLLVELS